MLLHEQRPVVVVLSEDVSQCWVSYGIYPRQERRQQRCPFLVYGRYRMCILGEIRPIVQCDWTSVSGTEQK